MPSHRESIESDLQGNVMKENDYLDPCFETTEEIFAVRIEGDNMQSAGIKDGDVVIIANTKEFQDNQIVVAAINNISSIRRYRQVGEYHVFLTDNLKKIDIFTDLSDVRILGRVIGIALPDSF